MKKVVLSLFIFAFGMIPISVVGQEVVQDEVKAPVWEEYVPQKYLEPRSFPNKGKNIAELSVGVVLTDLLITAPIGVPMIVHSSTKMKNQGWYEKKLIYENGIKEAENIDDPEAKRLYYEELKRQCKFTEKRHAKRLKEIAKENRKN